MEIGVNTFGLGSYLHSGGDRVWHGLLAGGITAVEPCVAFRSPKDPDDNYRAALSRGVFDGVFPVERASENIAKLRKLGFSVSSFQLQETPFLPEEFPAVLSFMEKNDLKYCVVSPMSGSVARLLTLEDTLRQTVKLFRRNGREFLLHNHDREWMPDQGTSVMKWLLEHMPELNFEIDLGWTRYAGINPVALLKKYPSRFPLLHIKEIAKGAVAWTGKPFWRLSAFPPEPVTA